MKQIKTIISSIERAEQFDLVVNELISKGWFLTKREVINTQGILSDSFNAPVAQSLYAELEFCEPIFEEITE